MSRLQALLAPFLAAFVALCSFGRVAPSCEEGRVMIAARMMAFAGSASWRNPYVTDGLALMWDGEWNVAPGQHDATSRVWKSVVGGNVLTLADSASFGDKFLQCTKEGGAYSGELFSFGRIGTLECAFVIPDGDGESVSRSRLMLGAPSGVGSLGFYFVHGTRYDDFDWIATNAREYDDSVSSVATMIYDPASTYH